MIGSFFSQYGIKLIATFFGAAGFCLFFHVKKDKLVYAVFGSMLSILTLFICESLGVNLLLQNMIAAVIATLYAEMIARVVKAPATVFIISGIIPLTPGSALYYTMSAMVDGDMPVAEIMAKNTGTIALGIALGIVLVSVIFYQLTHRNVQQKSR